MKKFIVIFIIFFTIVYEAKTVTIIGVLDEISSSDPTRVIKVDGNITIHKNELKLFSVKKELKIEIIKPFHMPNILTIQRGDDNISVIESRKSQKRIEFIIKKSDLKNGDKIIIETKIKARIVELNIVK